MTLVHKKVNIPSYRSKKPIDVNREFDLGIMYQTLERISGNMGCASEQVGVSDWGEIYLGVVLADRYDDGTEYKKTKGRRVSWQN